MSSLYEMELNISLENEEQKNYTQDRRENSPKREYDITPNSARSVGSDIEKYGPSKDISSLSDGLSSPQTKSRKAEKRSGYKGNLDQVY